MGLFHPFLDDRSVEIYGVEAAGHGLDKLHAASVAGGRPGVLHGNRTYLLMDADGQIQEAHSISAGLDYPGIGPEHSWLADMGRVKFLSATDGEALEAFKLCSRLEGIIPALESAHALARLGDIASGKPKDHLIVVNLSGRGDKDLDSVAKHLGGNLVMRRSNDRQKRTGWMLVVVSAVYLVWFFKVRLLGRGLADREQGMALFHRHEHLPDAWHRKRPHGGAARREAQDAIAAMKGDRAACSVHVSPVGRGRPRSGRVRGLVPQDGRSVRSIISSTPSIFSYTSILLTRTTRKPSASSARVRCSSRFIATAVVWVTPSTSTTSFPSSVTKSTTYRSMGCWRRNFQRSSFRFLNACQSRNSALVCDARSFFALFANRCIPLTRPLRGRPLPTGERCIRVCVPV